MVHWVFSKFGKHPIVSRSNSKRRTSTPPPEPVEVTNQGVHTVVKQAVTISSPDEERKRDSDLNSQRASAGSSTLATRPSRAPTAESSQSISHNLRTLGEVSAPTPATFYSRDVLGAPPSRGSMSIDAINEPQPSWPLPESILSGRGSASIPSVPSSPPGHTSLGHRRSFSNSSRIRAASLRPRTSHELGLTSPECAVRSHEHLRTQSRTGPISPRPLENVMEVPGPSSTEAGSNEASILYQSSGQTLVAASPEESNPAPPRSAPESLVQERRSSRKAPTITTESKNLRDVDPEKTKARPMPAHGSRHSQQGFLSVRSMSSRPPGSRSGETEATALPRFLYDQSNLEEQLEAARIIQGNTPPLSVTSGQNAAASRFATALYTVSYLIFFSILGTLARLGLRALTFYPGAPTATSELWPNFAGSFLLGFLAEDRRLFREEWGSHKPETPSFDLKNQDVTTPMSEKFHLSNRRGHRDEDHPSQIVSHARAKKTIPLFIGLATGFCGSFTSFSSFMRDSFLALSNELPTPISHTYPQGFAVPDPTDTIGRSAGYSVMAVIAVVLLTVCLSVGGLRFGAHFAILLDQYMATIRFATLRGFIDPLFVILAWGTWTGAIVMCIWPPDRPGGPISRDGTWASETWRGQALFACAFAPIGCLIRYYVSTFLNALSVSFPLGTFAVNVFGTAVEGMAFDLQHIRIGALAGGGRVPCQVLQGVRDGFCGSLTVVSTWAAELNGLRRHHAYVYGLSSVFCGLSLMVAIMGSVLWSIGWSEPVCSA